MEREFFGRKKKINPALYQYEKLFERNGFVDSDQVKKLLETQVVLTERGSKYRKEYEDSPPKTIIELARSKKLDKKQYEKMRKTQTLRTSISQQNILNQTQPETCSKIKFDITKKDSRRVIKNIKIKNDKNMITSRINPDVLPSLISAPSASSITPHREQKFSHTPSVPSISRLKQQIIMLNQPQGQNTALQGYARGNTSYRNIPGSRMDSYKGRGGLSTADQLNILNSSSRFSNRNTSGSILHPNNSWTSYRQLKPSGSFTKR